MWLRPQSTVRVAYRALAGEVVDRLARATVAGRARDQPAKPTSAAGSSRGAEHGRVRIAGEAFGAAPRGERARLRELPATRSGRTESAAQALRRGGAHALAASIRERGVLQPVLVRPSKTSDFELVAGERRWRAAAARGSGRVAGFIRDDTDDASHSSWR